MKKIPQEIKTHGAWIVLLKRLEGNFNDPKCIGLALYLNKSDGFFSGFEVHRIRIKPEKQWKIHERVIFSPEREVLASPKEFGFFGWAFPSLNKVYENFPIFKNHDKVIRQKLSKVPLKHVQESSKKSNRLSKECKINDKLLVNNKGDDVSSFFCGINKQKNFNKVGKFRLRSFNTTLDQIIILLDNLKIFLTGDRVWKRSLF